jgi:hypothetical protein
MKKLIAIVSVLAAGFVGTAKADITMSAGSNLEVQSIGSSTNLSIGGSLGFAFSQDLGNGVTVTMSGLSFGNDVAVSGDGIVSAQSLTQETTRVHVANVEQSGLSCGSSNLTTTCGVDAGLNTIAFSNVNALTTSTLTAGAVDADAFEAISFTTANGTLTYAADLEVDYAGLGVGDVTTSDLADANVDAGSSTLTTSAHDGNGFSYSTSVGGTALTVGYLLDNSGGSDMIDTSGTFNSTIAVKAALPLGPLSTTIGYTQDDNTDKNTTMGASASMAAGAGTLSIGYVTSDAATDTTEMSAAYSTSLGAAAVAVGYSTVDTDGAANTNTITGRISQSVGTGASVFAEFVNRTGKASSSGEGSSLLLGSSFAF